MASATHQREQQRGTDRGGNQFRPSELMEGRVGDVMTSLRDYAKKNPESAALWCFGIGFVLGWKLKPW